MKLIEADKVRQAIKNYWKAQVDKALFLTDGNEKRINIYLEHNHELLKAIDGLPSAEPDTTTHDSIPAETGKNDGVETSGDCISRTQAIDALRGYLVEKRCPDDGTLTCRLIENEVINKLPSIQPERKTGRWIESNPQDSKLCRLMTCSECGKAYIVNINVPYEDWTEAHKFCVECGADMRPTERNSNV